MNGSYKRRFWLKRTQNSLPEELEPNMGLELENLSLNASSITHSSIHSLIHPSKHISMSIRWARSLSNGQRMYWSPTMKGPGIHSEDFSLDLPQGQWGSTEGF